MKWGLLPVLIRAVREFCQTSSPGCFALLSGCGEELSGPSGSFHSPGYPNRYPSNRECIWYIHTAPGSSIQLTIQEFDIEYHPNCSYDVLEVRAFTPLKCTSYIHFCLVQIIPRTADAEQTILPQFPFLSRLQLCSTGIVIEAIMFSLFFAFIPLVTVYLN